MTNEAIQKDVSNENKDEERKVAPTPELNPNNEFMDDLAKRHQEARDKQEREYRENNNLPVNDIVPPPEDPELPAKEVITPAIEPKTESDEVLPPSMRTIKVLGVEEQVSEDDILQAGIATLQKERAADEKLRIAAEKERAADLRQEELNKQFEQREKELSEMDAETLTSKLTSLDDDEVKEAVSDLIGRTKATQPTGVNPNEVNELVEFQLAMKDFTKPADQGGYGDLMNDPYLKNMVISKESEKRDSGDDRPYAEVFAECGNEVRNWMTSIGGNPQQNDSTQDKQTDELEQRRKKAAEIDSIKGTSLNTSQQPNQAPKPRTRAEVLAGMAKARNQE